MTQDSEWHSVAVVFDGDEDFVYVDGDLTDTETMAKWIDVDGDGTVWIKVGE